MRSKEVIDEVIELNKYYDLSEYDFSLGYDDKSKVICPKHGVMQRRFRDLKRNLTCIKCNKEVYINPQKETDESYIQKLNSKFPNHNLDLKGFSYPNNQHFIIKVRCKIHGEFETTPNRMLNLKVQPCPKCSCEQRGVSEVGDVEGFIKKAKEKFGNKYSYEKVSFTRLAENVEVYCNKHKEYFKINANNFIYSAKIGCPKCIQDIIKETQRVPQDEFIRRCKKAHGDSFDLSEAIYDGGARKVKVKCNTCDNIFYPLADNFMGGSGCPFCANVNKFNKWKDFPTKLYVIKLWNGLYKIGVTSKTVRRRYHKDLQADKYEVIYEESFPEGREPFTIEQKVRSKIWEYNYKGKSPFRVTGTNEVFTINPIPTIKEVKKELERRVLNAR